jgi:hypothetical protein
MLDGRFAETSAERRARIDEYVRVRGELLGLFERMRQVAAAAAPADPLVVVVPRVADAMLSGGVVIGGVLYWLVAIDGEDVEKPRSG